MKTIKKSSLIRRFAGLNLGAALIVLGTLPATAITYWSGGGTDAYWQTTANWNGAPSGDTLSFGGTTRTTTTNDFSPDTSFAGINFTNAVGPAFTNFGNEITLGGNIQATATNSTGTNFTDVIAHDLLIPGNCSILGTNNHSIALTGNITLSGAAKSLTIGAKDGVALNGAGGAITFSGPGANLIYNDYNSGLTLVTNSRAINANVPAYITANNPAVIFNGTFTGSANPLYLQGVSTGANDFRCAISTANCRIYKDKASTWTLSGLYSSIGTVDAITVAAGTLTLNNDNNSFNMSGANAVVYSAGTLNVTSLRNYGTNCALGAPASSASLIFLGTGGGVGTLNYLGAGDTCDRQFRLKNAAILNNGTNGGTGLRFTAAAFNSPLGADNASRLLVLGGANTNANEISGGILDNSPAAVMVVTKTNAGTWKLSGKNLYSGATTISGGKLVGVTGGSCSNSVVTVSNTAGCVLGIAITYPSQPWANAGLTIAGTNAALDFDFGAAAPSTNVAPLQVNGDVNFSGIPTVTIEGGNFPAGTNSYPLMTWTGSINGTAPTTATLPPLLWGNLSVVGNTLQLNVTTNNQTLPSTSPAVFNGISVSGTTLTLHATNGTPNAMWTLLQSTNVALPLSQWQTNTTGNYNGSGNLSTNLLNTATNPMEFFILK